MLVPIPNLKLSWLLPAILGIILATSTTRPVRGQQPNTPTQPQTLTIKADIQSVNTNTGVATARGNVRLLYPARGIQATAAQAQYFSRERRIVLSGNVYVLQAGGNQLRAETITYLMDEDRFVALPANSSQVESVIIIRDQNAKPPTP